MAGVFHEVIADGVATGIHWQPVATGHRFSAVFTPIGRACFTCLCIVAVFTCARPLRTSSAAKPANLIGFAASSKSPFVVASTPNIFKHMNLPIPQDGAARVSPDAYFQSSGVHGINSSPLRNLIRFALKATNADNADNLLVGAEQLEDEVNEDTAQEGIPSMTDDTKARLAKVKEEVILKARDMAGITEPLGFFDPLGFSTDASEGRLLFYREVELKHGRVAMLASLGFLVGEQFHPLFGGDIDVPSYIAFQATPLQTFWPAVLAAIAIPEIPQITAFKWPFETDKLSKQFFNEDRFSISSERLVSTEDGWSIDSNRAPGDLGFDPLRLKPKSPSEFLEMQNKEINNGRLAMIAAAGMVAQELATGKKLF